MTKGDRPILEATQRMLDRAMQEYCGKSSVADAWASRFSDKDLVGIKINCLAGPRCRRRRRW